MLSTDQYAASVVEKYRVNADIGSPPHRAADEMIPILKQWAKQYLLGITLSGAYAKNTAVSVSCDVDVLVALSPVPGVEIKNIFWKLFECLSEENLRPQSRTVSVQVEVHGLKVDVIPTYRDDGTSGNILYNKKLGGEVQTDVARHVHLIGNSGRQQEICAFKIWRERAKLDFPSFYLELTVLQALGSARFGQLAENVLAVLHYLANRFEKTMVRDPANRDNVISNDLGEREKKAIAKAARDALYEENWKKILW